MTDLTLISPFLFLLIRTVVIVTLVLYGYRTVRRLAEHASSTDKTGFALFDHLLRQNGGRLTVLLFLSVSAGYFLSREMVYRPKTTPPAVATPEEREVPEFKPEAPKPKWDEVNGKNKQQNEDARKTFEQLPDSK